MDDLKKIFGNRIGNALARNGISNISKLKEYIVDYPFYTNTRSYLWRGIGLEAYKIIETYFEGV